MLKDFRCGYPEIIHGFVLPLKTFDWKFIKCLNLVVEVIETITKQVSELSSYGGLANAAHAREENATRSRFSLSVLGSDVG
jgi:hypothetical protein